LILKENNHLRQNPDTQRLEEELVEVKLRDAEAQLAIKELKMMIQNLNIEYQVSLSMAISNVQETIRLDELIEIHNGKSK
jgi:hypothetical protein